MGQKKIIPGDIHAQTIALVDMTRQLSRKRLAGGQTPADRNAALAQQAARVDLAAARNSVAIAGTLTAIAGQVGFESCTLDVVALRGALLTVMDNAADAEKVAEYRQRDAEFQASKRRMVQGVRGLVAASRPGAELTKAARALGLRRDLLAGGLIGRASPEAFAALGRDHNCTVSVTVQGELVQLVNKGVVDEDVLGLIGGQAQDNPELPLAPMSEGRGGRGLRGKPASS
ncbi:hypothetical protein [Devosia salina]|uniref:Uncharacterized protein n=1 Tax=Devosia salina TaxID=2860336 RepID=A0ABX8WMV2_9HYPH|nr:hypothetical protein [Devosia salina]QYO78902.1 hypothetical protein K1X15_10350 [Devosia salina]